MRPEKESMIAEMTGDVTGADFVILVDHSGLNVERISELRNKLCTTGAKFHIVRNRLFKLVAEKLEWKKIQEHLRGPTATITGKNDVAAARVLKEVSLVDNRPVIKAGMAKNVFLPAEEVKRLASLPSLVVMREIFARMVAAPMTQLAGVMNQRLLSLLYVLQAVRDKKA